MILNLWKFPVIENFKPHCIYLLNHPLILHGSNLHKIRLMKKFNQIRNWTCFNMNISLTVQIILKNPQNIVMNGCGIRLKNMNYKITLWMVLENLSHFQTADSVMFESFFERTHERTWKDPCMSRRFEYVSNYNRHADHDIL